MKRYSLLSFVFGILIFSLFQSVPLSYAVQGDLGAVIESLEFDTADGITPHIININGNFFAVVYEGTSDDAKIVTFSVDGTNGDVSNTVTDGPDTFDTGATSNPKLFHVTGTTYAVAYEENGSIKFDTFDITNAGIITQKAPTTFTLGSTTVDGKIDVVGLSGTQGGTQFYAVAYRTSAGAGNVATFSVTANGDTVAQVTAGTQFTATANNLEIIKIGTSEKYAVVYRDSSNKGQVEIITITDNGGTITPGDITLALNSNSAISSSSNLDIAHVTGTLYAVVWSDGTDAKVQTITIPDNGASITAGSISAAIDATGVPSDPVLIQTDSGSDPRNFVIAYHDTTAIKGELRSVTISNAGTVTLKDTIKFDNNSPGGMTPSLAHSGTGAMYAVTYKGSGANGFVTSFNLGDADSTPPTVPTNITITSNNSVNTLAKSGNIVSVTFDTESGSTCTGTIDGKTASCSVTGTTGTLSRTMDGTETAGVLTFSFVQTDSANNSQTAQTAVKGTGSATSVTADFTAPSVTSVAITSNGNSGWAKVGNTVTITVVDDETLTVTAQTIGGQTATVGTTGATTVTQTRVFTGAETPVNPSIVPFSIRVADAAGNTVDLTAKTTGTNVIADFTAPTFSSASIVGNGDLSIVYSEPVISTNTAHYSVEWPDGTAVTVSLLAGSGTKTILVDTTAIDADGNDGADFSISSGVTDLAGNALSPTIALESNKIAAAAFVQPTLSGSNTDITLSANTLITTITATSVSPNVNLSGLGGGANTATFPASAITVDASNADVLFPAGVVASGLPADEIIEVSVSTKTASTSVLPSGQVAGTIIELGDPDTTITFSAPVKVTLTGQAGNTPFIVTSTPTTVLVDTCADGSATVAPTLGSIDPTNAASHCAIIDGANLIIWTRHFTGFGSSSTPTSGGGGGGGGDDAPPSISIGFDSNEYPIKYDGVNYNSQNINDIHTAVIKTGSELKATLKLYENEGPGNVKHVEMYLNQFGSRILNDLSETIVIYDEQSGLEIVDPHNLITTADVTPSTSGNKAAFDFVIVFKNEISQSDVMFRLWDTNRNSMQIHLPDALIVEMSEQSSNIVSIEPELGETESDTESEISVPKPTPTVPKTVPETSESVSEGDLLTKSWTDTQLSVLKQWGGYDTESASDADVLAKFGIKGEKIPSYLKQNVKWILMDQVSHDEFVNALQYLKRQGFLSNSVGQQSFDVRGSSLEGLTSESDSLGEKFEFDSDKILSTITVRDNLDDIVKILRSLSNNEQIQNELAISNMEFKTLTDPSTVIDQRNSEWLRNPTTVTPFMESLMNNEPAQIANAIIEHHKDDLVPITGILITNEYGVNVAMTQKIQDYKQNDEQWWDKTKSSGLNIMSGSSTEEYTGLYTAEISISVTDSQGNFIGIIKAVTNFEKALLLE